MIDNDAMQAIATLDLEPIKIKLMHQSGEGWSKARADAIDTEYRRFLCLQHTYQGEAASPTTDVDIFWHYHILDTRKYAADCDQAFGYFMHHYPYLGLLEGDKEGAAAEAGDRTCELYETTFGEPYIREESYGADGNGIDAARFKGRPVFSHERVSTSTAARCQYCIVTKPLALARKAARCQYCIVAKPGAEAAIAARC